MHPGRHEDFTVEGGWSCDGRFPLDQHPAFPIDIPEHGIRRDLPKDGRLRFRLTDLWNPKAKQFWEILPTPTFEELQKRLDQISRGVIDEIPVEKGLENIKPMVNDAVQRFASHAVPYFLEVAKSLGQEPTPL